MKQKYFLGDDMSVSDNGGAIAIKGFNFQKASAILVMLHNLDDENLIFIP